MTSEHVENVDVNPQDKLLVDRDAGSGQVRHRSFGAVNANDPASSNAEKLGGISFVPSEAHPDTVAPSRPSRRRGLMPCPECEWDHINTTIPCDGDSWNHNLDEPGVCACRRRGAVVEALS